MMKKLVCVCMCVFFSCVVRLRGVASPSTQLDPSPVHVETWDDLINVGKQKKAAKCVGRSQLRNTLR